MLESLPSDAILRVARYLDAGTLGCLAQCSRSLAAIVIGDAAWEHLAPAAAAGECPSARERMRAVVTLELAHWEGLSGAGIPEDGVTVVDAGPAVISSARTTPEEREKFAAFLYGGTTLLVFGGRTYGQSTCLNDCWALDTVTSEWTRSPAPGPARRCFGADGGGGGILSGRDGREWLAVHGGLRPEGFRDNETWLLGPLGAAADASHWRWYEVQPGGGAQSRARPPPRFHHSFNILPGRGDSSSCMVLLGGHGHTISPILSPWVLDLGDLAVSDDGHVTGADSVQWHEITAADDPETGSLGSPPPRANHSAVVWPGQGLVVFGGNNRVPLEDTWLLASSHTTATAATSSLSLSEYYDSWEWIRLASDGAMTGPRSHAAATIVHGERLMIFGGYNYGPNEDILTDIWALDLQTPAEHGWQPVTETGFDIPQQVGATAVAVHGGKTVLLLGGYDAGNNGNHLDQFADPEEGALLCMGHTWAGKVRPRRTNSSDDGMPGLELPGRMLVAPPRANYNDGPGCTLSAHEPSAHELSAYELGSKRIGAVCVWTPPEEAHDHPQDEQMVPTPAPMVVAVGASSSDPTAAAIAGCSGALAVHSLSFTTVRETDV